MSINAMTNAAMSRRPDFEPANAVPEGFTSMVQATGAVSPAPVAKNGLAGTPVSSLMNTSLQTLTTYIPTEILTLYVAAVAALSPASTPPALPTSRWAPYLVFLVLTPATLWVAFATKIKAAGRKIPANPKRWPVWEMVAASIAFTAWTFALPETPFTQFERWYSRGLAGFLVVVVSYGLGLLGPLMQRPLSD